MRVSQISWVLYIVGSLLVFGSWIQLVPTGLAWFGWVIALAGWGLSAATNRQVASRSRADEITKLDHLRQQGVVTEEEFQKAKKRILKNP